MFEIFVEPFRPTSAAFLGRTDNGDCLRSQEAINRAEQDNSPWSTVFGQTSRKYLGTSQEVKRPGYSDSENRCADMLEIRRKALILNVFLDSWAMMR